MYKIITLRFIDTTSIKKFEKKVEKSLKKGYKLAGGICVKTYENGDEYFYQALYKEEK